MERKKKTGVVTFISDKIDLNSLIVTKTERNKEGYYRMVKGSMQQQESMIINIYAPNIGTPRYIRHVLNDL